LKDIKIEVDSSCGTSGLPVELQPASFSPHTWSADEKAAFNIIAIATSPPTYVGFTLADTWAHNRYFASLHSGSALRLRHEWDDLDSHQKTILADDFGVGFPLLYLKEKLQLDYLSPTGWWLKGLEKISGKPIKLGKKKHGPPKLPDYICVDSTGYFHAVENKGTQTSRRMLNKQINKGIEQVENMRAGGLPHWAKAYFRSWIVGGIYIPQHRSRSDAAMVFADPDFSDLLTELEDQDGLRRAREAVRLVSLCQQLTSIGLRQLGTALFNGRVDPGYRDLVRPTADGNAEASFMGFRREDESWVTSSVFRAFDTANRARGRRSAREYTLNYSIDAKVLLALTKCFSDSGVLSRHALAQVLDEIAPLVHPDEPPNENFLLLRGLERAEKPRRWHHNFDAARSAIETPFKIRYETIERNA